MNNRGKAVHSNHTYEASRMKSRLIALHEMERQLVQSAKDSRRAFLSVIRHEATRSPPPVDVASSNTAGGSSMDDEICDAIVDMRRSIEKQMGCESASDAIRPPTDALRETPRALAVVHLNRAEASDSRASSKERDATRPDTARLRALVEDIKETLRRDWPDAEKVRRLLERLEI